MTSIETSFQDLSCWAHKCFHRLSRWRFGNPHLGEYINLSNYPNAVACFTINLHEKRVSRSVLKYKEDVKFRIDTSHIGDVRTLENYACGFALPCAMKSLITRWNIVLR